MAFMEGRKTCLQTDKQKTKEICGITLTVGIIIRRRKNKKKESLVKLSTIKIQLEKDGEEKKERRV